MCSLEGPQENKTTCISHEAICSKLSKHLIITIYSYMVNDSKTCDTHTASHLKWYSIIQFLAKTGRQKDRPSNCAENTVAIDNQNLQCSITHTLSFKYPQNLLL